MNIATLTFNPFQENTHIVWDDAGQAAIFDPGCADRTERQELDDFISQNKLNPVRLINTHCHIDHVLGNGHVMRQYDLDLWMHQLEVPVLKAVPEYAGMWGMQANDVGSPGKFIADGEVIEVGTLRLEAIFTPGHSPGSLSFYERKAGKLIAGDVLFQGSIGRTDLPGGDLRTLILSIVDRLMPLPDATVVYPGHGPNTTIGAERATNPFVLHYAPEFMGQR